MSLKYAHFVSFIFIIGLLSLAAVANAQSSATPEPSQVNPGDIKGAIVTLYYYNPVTGGKGAIVPLPDSQNPQEVIWDSTKAAPGTYTFYRVPQGNYYVEAVHGNHTWFALVTVDQGTSTANVAIPPYNDTGFLATPSPQASPSALPTAIPSESASPTPTPTPLVTPSPGMTTLAALTGLTLVAWYVVTKRK
jgi:hypothetical protein